MNSVHDRGSAMSAFALAAIAATAALALAGCGGSGDRQASKSEATAAHATAARITGPSAPAFSFAVAHSLRGLKGDEDDDDPESKTEGQKPYGDEDADEDNDRLDNRGRGYYDPDDAPVRDYGHVASSVQARALLAAVGEYARAAAAEDGTRACELLAPEIARLALLYGQPGGTPYLRGASTCPQVMTRQFAHVHGELAGPLYAVAERVSGHQAKVLVGSRGSAATAYALVLLQGHWRVQELLPRPLP
jgi:hypothetical protein